jgi:hypothetical protein
MANVFNSMLRGVNFQELCAIGGNIMQLILFVRAFYAFESPLFYKHHKCENNVTVILSTMGICQGDPLGGALFTLVHFRFCVVQLVISFLVYFDPL